VVGAHREERDTVKKTKRIAIDRSGRRYYSLYATALAAVTVALVLLLMPLHASADPILDSYADEVDALPAPPQAGQGAKGQGCAGIITLDKKEVNDNDTISVEILIPAPWRDEIDYVQIVAEGIGSTAVPMGNGLYVFHFTASAPGWRDRDYRGDTVFFHAYKGKDVLCTGAAYYSVHFRLNVGIRSSASSIQSGDEVTFTAMVSGDMYSHTPPLVYSWDLAGESRQITRDTPTDIQVKSFSLAGEHTVLLIVVDAEGRRGWGVVQLNVYKDGLPVAVGGPVSLDVGEKGTWTAEASGGKPPYKYNVNCDESGWTDGQSCSRSFDTPGRYFLQLRAEDSNDSYGIATIAVNVRESLAVSLSCVSQAEVGKDAMCTAMVVSGGKGPYDFSFDWGDGGKTTFAGVDSVSQSAGHVYGHTGTYPVSVAVRDSTGLSGFNSISVSVVSVECTPDEQKCGEACVPASLTCCNNDHTCPAGYPCCGIDCCYLGEVCVRAGLCCKAGHIPCPDGKICCSSTALCHPDKPLCCPEGTVPVPGSGDHCRRLSAQGELLPAIAPATGESFMMKNRSTPVIFLETEGVFPFSK
jgi:PKD repeat protein